MSTFKYIKKTSNNETPKINIPKINNNFYSFYNPFNTIFNIKKL